MDGTSKSTISDQFEPDVFWEQHRGKIIPALIAVLAVGLVVFYRQRQVAEREQHAAASLAQATDVRSLEGIVQSYPRSEVAAQALLRIADMHFQAGRYNEAGTAYQGFANDFSRHPLIQSALLGLAAVQEAQGDLEDAKGQYLRIVSTYPKGYAVGSARMGAARCAEALGRIKEARQAYEEFLPTAQGSAWQAEAYLRWVVLAREHKVDLPEQPQSPQQQTLPSLELTPPVQGQK
jgi:tetratricopeptide (TPR) repeat protein